MPKKSAGILLFRRTNKVLEVLLVHPGGPFWAKRDYGIWSIPKGEFTDENPLDAAKREFEEETGMKIDGNFIELHTVKTPSGKTIYPWTLESDMDTSKIVSNTFRAEWPPHSGKYQEFPEIDRGEWFVPEIAKKKINTSQIPLIEELISILKNL